MTSIAWVLLTLLIISTTSLILLIIVFVKLLIRIAKAIKNLPEVEQKKFAETVNSKGIKVNL